ncbi:arsenate reductase family protein [Bizionia sediminis]|uniref:Arsenate reductase family protein n=1 Tax=Bizionia sediminis TaxID=1737064 RepID=A0ABW5KSK0_9FLAO
MGTIAKNKREVKLYYNSNNSLGQQAFAYVQATNKDVLAIDISKTKVTGTQWTELAKNLDLAVADLVDKKHPNFKEAYGSEPVNLKETDWIKVLQSEPTCLKGPVLINGSRHYLIKTPSEVSKYLPSETH